MVECAFSGCGNTFEPNVKKRQKYCSSQCSVRANNQKAMREYHERKNIMSDGPRVCSTVGCPTILRRTNHGEYCDPCVAQRKVNQQKNFRNLVMGQ